jgi:uncharacterized membrane protein HdeD (DUF308 family)
MTNASDTMRNLQAGSDMAPLRAKWGWIVALGVVYLLAGFIALGSVVMATVASVLVVGVMMIIAGVAEVFSAFQIKSWGKFLFWVLLGVLYIIAGFVTFENPLLAAALLTLILGASLVASGVMRIILAFSMKRETPWIWVLLSGAITLLSAPRGSSIGAKEAPMRWFYLAVIVLFAAATIVFALQNFEIVTISFLGSNLRVPQALLVAVVYLLGAATGGSLFALLRRSYQGSRRSMMVSS